LRIERTQLAMQAHYIRRCVTSPFAALAVVEFVALCAAVYAAGYLRFSGDLGEFEASFGAAFPRAVEFSAVVQLILVAVGLYQSRQRAGFGGVLARMIVAFGASGLVLMSLYYLLPPLHLWRGVLALEAVIAFALIGGVRVLFSRIVDEGVFRRRVLLLGAGKRATRLERFRRRTDRRGFEIVGFLACTDEEIRVDSTKLIRKAEGQSLLELAWQHNVDEIVIAMDDRRKGYPHEQLLACRFGAIAVSDLVEFLERQTGRVDVELLHPSFMILGAGFTRSAVRRFSACVLDVVGGLTLLAFTLPVMLLAALAIHMDDGGPILYRQVRVGLHGRRFELLKFRSMRVDAEEAGKAQWARRHDDRITRVGRVLRKYRIDELPQLLNIIAGHMSVVGPRPERPEFVDELANKIPYYRSRLSVKPGLTGWAQLCYPYGASENDAAEKLQFDLYYVKNHNLLFDLSIVLQTAEVVLWQKGAR
jgi:sugar transferase (PEP-CTERM system associated)